MPLPILPIVSGLASVFGGLFGDSAAEKDRKRAAASREAALKALQDVNTPGIDEQKIQLKQLELQGQLTPEMVETISQDPSAMKDITTDPRLKDATMGALDRLSQRGQEGFTAQDRAGLISMNKGVERDAKGRNDAILQSMAQRGMGGAGNEMAMQIANSQAAAERAQTEGSNLAGQAQQRALEATIQGGNLASSLQGQEFGQKSQQAQAEDAISRFNASNRQAVSSGNVGARNAAAEANLRAKQDSANKNVGLANEQEMYNKRLIQSKFDNDMRKAGGMNTANNAMADSHDKNASATAGMYAGIGQGLGQVGTSIYGQKVASDNRAQDLLERQKDRDAVFNSNMPGKSVSLPASNDWTRSFDGGKIPGEAKYEGDHPENDNVPMLLSPGEAVIPKSIMESSDDAVLAFIRLMKKHKDK